MYHNTITTKIAVVFALVFNFVFTQVVINEIHYNPGSSQGSDFDYEFLELYNAGAAAVDMSGWSFTQGVTHVFADGTSLAAGGYMVVSVPGAASQGSLDTNPYDPDGDGLMDNGAVVVEWTSGGLTNGGEDITIVDATGAVMDSVDYEDGTNAYGDWGTAHDGGGGSLELKDPSFDNKLAENWQTSWVVGGTPGAASSEEPPFTVMTIYDVQYTTNLYGTSDKVDQQVQVTGIVTAIDRLGFNSNFVIQSATGAWNGIYCWWAADDGVVLGDEVTVRGTVAEYAGYGDLGDPNASLTQLTNGSIFEVLSSGNALPAPVELDISNVGQEQYEGVLVKTTARVVEEAVYNSDDPFYNYGEWRMSNNIDASLTDADTINVNDRFAETDPAFGSIATVTGVLNQWGGSNNTSPAWKIEPATEADVTISCPNANLTVSVEMFDSFGDGWNGATYSIVGPSGGIVATGGLTTGSYAIDNICLFEGNFSVIVGGGSYDGEISFNILNAWGTPMIAGGVANLNPNPPYIPDPFYAFEVTGVNELFGCTDATAENYDPQAGVDDGSCLYTGDTPEYPYSLTGTTNADGFAEAVGTVMDASVEQWFQYTPLATGNLTVSTVGVTTNDTYLAVLANTDTIHTYVDGELFITYENVIGENDDYDYGAGVFQSELTFCVTAGDPVLIGWIPQWYDPENPDHSVTHEFDVYETPDITTPVNVSAFGYEDGVALAWSPIPVGCAGDGSTRASLNSSGSSKPFYSKAGPMNYHVGKQNTYKTLNPERAQSSRSEDINEEQIRVPYLTRDCDAGTSEITFVMSGSSYASECTYTVTDDLGNIVATATGAATEVPISVCLADGDYDVLGEDSWGDGWNGGVFTATNSDGSVIFSLGMASGSTATGSFNLNSSAVYGCTDSDALNYDAAATEDDGSCYYTGDICSAPVLVDPTVGVTSSNAEWFSVSVPANAGMLTYTTSGADYTYFYTYSTCSYEEYPTYTGRIGYSGYVAGGSSTMLDFSETAVDYNGLPMSGYLGTTVLINNSQGAQVDIAWTEYVPGCTDPNASNYDPNANFDDGSCECAGLSVLMTMNDSWGDGWNGGGYVIQDASGTEVASGTMSGSLAVDEICISSDGTYSIYVADGTVAPLSSYPSEITWTLTSAENGQLIASGGAPYTPSSGDGIFTVPLPAYTFALYRDNVVVPGADALTSSTYYDSLTIGGVANLVAGTDYCYTVTQTTGTGSPSGQSDPTCSGIYVPSSCNTAMQITLDVNNNIDGINGRNEWFYHVPTMDGYLTVTSDLPENNPVSNDTRLWMYEGPCYNTQQIAYDDDGGTGYLSVATVPVFEGDTVYVLWDNYWSPGPSVFTATEFGADHQPPSNLSAVPDHEAAHLSWAYPQDPVSAALRLAEDNGNTVEQNVASITTNDMLFAEKVDANRQELYQAHLSAQEDAMRNTRSLDGTSISVMGSVLNDDGTADVLVAVTVASPDVSYMDAIALTFPTDITINSGAVTSGTMPDGTSSATCGITLGTTANSIIFGDASFVDDPATGSGWGCFNFATHMFSVNVQAYFGDISVDYVLADDCYQSCLDMTGTLTVPEPTDAPLCINDAFEPNDFLESPDTWTVAGTGTSDLTICPADIDIFTVPGLGYGGWLHLNIAIADTAENMTVSLWDLNISDYPILTYNTDTVDIHYQNLGSVTNPHGPTQLVWTVEGETGTSQFDYTGSSEVMQPEVYAYNVHAATVGTDGSVTVETTPIEDMIMGYNYTVGNLVNDTEYHFVVTTTNSDSLTSGVSSHVSVTPRADVPFPPNNLVGEPGLQSAHLSWEPPNDQRPGNLIQSAYSIDMLPFSGSGNTFGFQNNYDDCSDMSESPDVVYKYSPTADVQVNISSCESSFDTKIYVYENTTDNMVACNEDGGFYDYYYCGYYTSYVDTLSLTAGNDYYIVVDGWGGDFGAYQLDVYDITSGEGQGWAIGSDDVETDLEAKALAVEENIASYDQGSSSERSLNGYMVFKWVNQAWQQIATTSINELEYVDAGLNTDAGQTYKYVVKADFDSQDSDPSNEVEVTPIAPITVPTPVNFTANANGWLIELNWQDPDLGGGQSAYMENFDDGTLGTMTSASLNPAGGPTWSVGTADDAASTYWGPPENGTFAYYNDDASEYTYDYTWNYIKSQTVDLTAVPNLSADAITGLSAVGELYFTQPSGPCDGGGAYAEELKFHVSANGGAYTDSVLVSSTAGWEMVEIPLGLPSNATTVEVWFAYSDCGGTWSYGVALDDFALMVPPEYNLLGYNVYKNGNLYVQDYQQSSLIDVVNMEGDYTYGVTTVLDIFGESTPVEQLVSVTAPVAAMNPPRNLTAMSMGYTADLQWDPPAGSDQWITNSASPDVGNALGSDQAFDFQVASRFPAQVLVEFQGKELREVEFMGGSNVAASNYIVQIHKSSVNGQNPILLYESEIIPGSELQELAPNWHELENPIQIGVMPGTPDPNAVAVGEELWIGLRCISAGTAATYPAVLDQGPTNNGLGNLVNGFGSDGWVSLADQFAFEGNWLIRGFVGWPQENFLANGGFEEWYQEGWQRVPSDYLRIDSFGNPYGNFFNAPMGDGIHSSTTGATLQCYEGESSLKMWGMYAGAQNMWGAFYQSFTALHLGGAGAHLDISAMMMSHEDDWIGQNGQTNEGFVFISFWSDYYGTTYEGGLYSMPFNSSYTASDWHEIELMAMIPEAGATTGAPITYVNIGVQINQMNNDNNGSIYYDDFKVFPAEEMGPPPEGREPFVSSHSKRTDGAFRDQGSPKLLFAENFPASQQQRTDFDFLGYQVWRGTFPDMVMMDTLLLEGMHQYVDEVGAAGTYDYQVSALYADGNTGVPTHAPSNHVNVVLSNNAPSAVSLQFPANESTVTLAASDLTENLQIVWSTSTDADVDPITYELVFTTDYGVIDTLVGSSVFSLPVQTVYDLIVANNQTAVVVTWDVSATDGYDVTSSSNGPWTVTIDAGWLLENAAEDLIPDVFALHNNYPNPFNPITNIRYDIPEVSDVRIDIYNLMGQRVRTLVSKAHQPGRYNIQWNATNDMGAAVASGMYIYKIHAKDFTSVKKLLLMK